MNSVCWDMQRATTTTNNVIQTRWDDKWRVFGYVYKLAFSRINPRVTYVENINERKYHSIDQCAGMILRNCPVGLGSQEPIQSQKLVLHAHWIIRTKLNGMELLARRTFEKCVSEFLLSESFDLFKSRPWCGYTIAATAFVKALKHVTHSDRCADKKLLRMLLPAQVSKCVFGCGFMHKRLLRLILRTISVSYFTSCASIP